MKKRLLSLAMALGMVLGIAGLVFAGPQPGTSSQGGPQPRISQTSQLSGATTACGPGDAACFDRNGVIGGNASGTTDPTGVMVRGKQCSASDGTCTAGNVTIVGGAGIVDIQIDAGDPTANCPGDNDSVTFTVVNPQGTAVISAVVLTEGAQWTATASVADTCASLAAAFETACTVSSVDYCNASCTSPEVQFSLTPAAAAITQLIESTAACTTVAMSAHGKVIIGSRGHSAASNWPVAYLGGLAATDTYVYGNTGAIGLASVGGGNTTLTVGNLVQLTPAVRQMGASTGYDSWYSGAAYDLSTYRTAAGKFGVGAGTQATSLGVFDNVCYTATANMATLTDQTIFTVATAKVWHWRSVTVFDCANAEGVATFNAGCTAGMTDAGFGTMSTVTFNVSSVLSHTWLETASSTEGAAASACGINVATGGTGNCSVRVCGSLEN